MVVPFGPLEEVGPGFLEEVDLGLAFLLAHIYRNLGRFDGETVTYTGRDTGLSGSTFPGGDDDNAVSASGTVDSRCCGIFQDVDALDILRVQR